MEDYEKLLAEGYGLRLCHSRRTRKGLVLQTDRGAWELRKAQGDLTAVLFEHAVRCHTYELGFRQMEVWIPARDGRPFVLGSEAAYVLSRYEKREDAVLDTAQDVARAAGTLARLHQAMAGVTAEGPKSGGHLIEDCEKKQRELAHIRKWIYRQSRHSAVDELVLRQYQRMHQRIVSAQEALSGGAYSALCHQAEEERALCHHLFKKSVLEQDAKGNYWVTGFSQCTFDCPLTDLAEFLRRMLREDWFGLPQARQAMEGYERETPLRKEEKETLGAMLLFPARYLKLLSGYYNKRRTIKNGAFLEKLTLSVAQSEKEEALARALVQA